MDQIIEESYTKDIWGNDLQKYKETQKINCNSTKA